MAKLGDYEVHPVAGVFPLLEGEEFDLLVADVREHGLREPITLTVDDRLADGRNRLRACLAAGRDPVFARLPELSELAVVEFIVRANERRRHEGPGQRSMIAAQLVPFYEEAAGDRQRAAQERGREAQNGLAPIGANPSSFPQNGRKGVADAAAAVGAAVRTTERSRAVLKHDQALATDVLHAKVSLEAAEKQIKAERKRQAALNSEPTPKSTPSTITLLTHKGEPVQYPEPKGKAKFNKTPGDGISWATWSWNPVTGCLHGCEYCYAREIATAEGRTATAFPVGFTPLFHHERLQAPADTPVPEDANDAARRVFVCSMADLYGRWVPKGWIEQVHAVELENPQWTYIHLTKFPKRYLDVELPPTGWIGASVDEQKRVKATEEAFRQIEGVAVKWLSLEPLREELTFSDLSMFDWVVIGAQTPTRQPTGFVPGRRPKFKWVQQDCGRRKKRPVARSTRSRTC